MQCAYCSATIYNLQCPIFREEYCTKSTISSAEVTCDTTEEMVHLFKLASDL
jgi:hypothetical protein